MAEPAPLRLHEDPASGTMGAVIGVDLVNLPRTTELGVPVVSIGGAGTFDGVFPTGIIAGLRV